MNSFTAPPVTDAPLTTKNDAGKTPGRSPLQRLASLLLIERPLLWKTLLLQMLQSATYLPFFGALGILIDHILQNQALSLGQKGWAIAGYALANLLLWPLHGSATVAAFACSQRLVRATTARMRRALVDHLQMLSLSFFTQRGAGALSNQVTVDLTKVETFMNALVSNFTLMLFNGLLASGYLLFLNHVLGAIVILFICLQMLALRAVRRRVHPLQKRVQSSGEIFSAKIVEFIGGMRTTRGLGNEEVVAQHLAEAIEEMRDAGLQAGITMRWIMMGQQLIGEYLNVIIWCVGGAFFLAGQVTMGHLVVFTTMLGFVRQGIASFLGGYESWAQAKPGMEALLEILDSEELESHREAKNTPVLHGQISVDHLSFAYPGAADGNVLENVTLEIPVGQRVGLVGETGAGKSTFLDLVLGFYQAGRGEIRYDGRPIAEIGVLHLRRSIAIMGQDSFLWNTTVRENIRFGLPTASDTEVETAARQAQAHAFIVALKHGYDTICAERGSRLSGGQRQRIALARLFLRDPRIVILDEPTSALDLETEKRLQHDLEAFCQGRTTFIVAHRLSTLRGVDRVLVFRRGRIVEDGSLPELLAREGGHFRYLHSLQTAAMPAGPSCGTPGERD